MKISSFYSKLLDRQKFQSKVYTYFC